MSEYKNLYGEDDIEAAYQAALAIPLSEKVRKAILLIQEYEPKALELSPDGYYVAFSGGKDSIVMAKIFEMSGVKYQLWYNNVTIDPPELVRFIKDKYPQAKWNSGKKNLPAQMVNESQGPPTRIARWCCEIYKEQGGKEYFKSIGVRAEESARRKGAWQTLSIDRKSKTPVMCPILYFTEKDVWQFIRQEKLEYCSLYDEGFKRLGCIGCPMSGPTGQARDFARWPKYEEMWRRGFVAYWDKYKGLPRRDGGDRWIEKMETVDDLWKWWTSGKAYEGEKPDCQMWLW